MTTPSRNGQLLKGLLLLACALTLSHFALRYNSFDPRDLVPPLDDAFTIDLLDEARDARVIHETDAIWFGTPQGKAFYDEPDPRRHLHASGFRSITTKEGDVHYAVAIGTRATVRFHTFDEGPRRVTIEAAAVTDTPQQVTVHLNGSDDVAAQLTLPVIAADQDPGGALEPISFDLPRWSVTRGTNLLEFRFEQTVTRSVHGSEFRMPWAAVFRRITFEPTDTASSSDPAPTIGSPAKIHEPLARAALAGIRGKGGGEGLIIPQGGRVSIPLELPEGLPRLFGSIYIHPDDHADRDLPVIVRLRVDPAGRMLILKRSFDASTSLNERDVYELDYDLSLYHDAVARLEIETPAPPAGAKPLRLVLANPEIRVNAPPNPTPGAPRGNLVQLKEALEKRNLVLITLDAGAARHFTAYGQAIEYAKAVDVIARDGIVFEGVTSPASYTLPSIASLFTGQHPARHQLTDNGSGDNVRRLPEGTPTLASALRDHGYHTLALVTNPNAAGAFGFDYGFETYDELFRPARGLWQEGGGVSVDAMVDALEGHLNAGRLEPPFHLYLHLFPPHAPYTPPTEFRRGVVDPLYEGSVDGSRGLIEAYRQHDVDSLDAADFRALRDLYRANLGYASDGVERILRILLQRGLLNETIVAVVGDHGEAFGEHHNLEHGDTVYGEEIEVPWVMMLPSGASLKPLRVPGPASLVDVAPTLASLLSLAPPANASPIDGIDLSGRIVVEGGSPPPARPIVSRSVGSAPRYNLRYRGYSYHVDLYTREEQLFHLDVDPLEGHPLPTHDSPRADRMRAIVCRYLCERIDPNATEPVPLSPELRELAEQASRMGYTSESDAGSGETKTSTARGCPLRW